VLCTKELSFDEMLRLKAIEDLVETYYNSGKTVNTEKFVSGLFASPFEFYEKFSAYWQDKEYHRVNHSKKELYDIFYEFCCEAEECKKYMAQIRSLLKFDMLLSDNLKTLSGWVEENAREEFKGRKRDFYNNKELVDKYIPSLAGHTAAQLSRMCRIEEFGYNVLEFYEGKCKLEKKQEVILINYYSRDIITNNAHAADITEDF